MYKYAIIHFDMLKRIKINIFGVIGLSGAEV